MKKNIIFIATIFLLVLCFAGTVAAENPEDTTIRDELVESSPDTPEVPVNDINISGQVSKCSDGTLFQGATVTVTDYEKEVSTTTNTMGQYQLNFQSTNTNFMVTATAPGHNPEHQEIKLEEGADTYTANFQLGMDDVYVATWGDDGTGLGTPESPFRSIGKGITEVNNGMNVHVAAGNYNETLSINKNLNLIGENQDTTIIDAIGKNNRVITIGSGGTVTISNFTIQNGKHSGTNAYGGGIWNSGNLTINNCIIQNNIAETIALDWGMWRYSQGGGIFNSGGNMFINNCIIQDNISTIEAYSDASTAYGGGISNTGGIVTITDTTIRNNLAIARNTLEEAYALGGGIANYSAYHPLDSIMLIYNCNIYNNTAIANGVLPSLTVGAICNNGSLSYLTAHYNRISDNTPNAVSNYYGSADVRYNWWGSNSPDFTSLITGTTNYDPWIILTITADPAIINTIVSSEIIASLNTLSDGTNITDTDNNHIPNGTLVSFETDSGVLNPEDTVTTNGTAKSTFTCDGVGVATVSAQVDTETQKTTVEVVEKLDTEITVEPASGVFEGSAKIHATLLDQNGNPVVNVPVKFYIEEEAIGSSNTDENGQADIIYEPIAQKPGKYAITAEFEGDDNYNQSHGQGILNVKIETKTESDDKNNFARQNVELTANVTNIDGEDLDEGQVTFTANGEELETVNVVKGQANHTWTIPLNWNAGNYEILAQYTGTDTYAASQDTATLTVDKTPTNTQTVNANNFPGQNVDLTATVTDYYSNNLNEGQVQFTVKGEVVGTVDVVNGHASHNWIIPYNWNAGDYPLLAEYLGTTNYLTSQDTATLTVHPLPVASFTGSPTSGRANLTVKFTNKSTGTITRYEWDFNGDGKIDSTLKSPSYTYSKAGTYTVKLTVKGPGGTNTQTRTKYITVKLPDLVMRSVTAPTTARRGRYIRVRNQVRNSGTISTGKGFYVAFYLRSTKTSRRYYLGRRWVGNLGSGISSYKTNYFRVPRYIRRGRYYIQGVADYTKRIRETTRTNNIKYTTTRTRIS
ncbi:MAG: Ig-like domain repeat protein [Methanomicrobiales archaeon]